MPHNSHNLKPAANHLKACMIVAQFKHQTFIMILRLQKIEKTKCDNDIDHDSVNLEVLSPISNLYFPDISPSLLVLQGVIVLIFSIFGVSLLFSFECKTEANQSLNTIYISWIGGKKERKITKSIILKKYIYI